MDLSHFARNQDCSGIDLFFSKKPNALNLIGNLLKVYSVAAMLGKDTSEELMKHPLVKQMKVTTEKTRGGFKVTCMWPHAVSVNPLFLVQRTSHAFNVADGYTGCELYLNLDADATKDALAAMA